MTRIAAGAAAAGLVFIVVRQAQRIARLNVRVAELRADGREQAAELARLLEENDVVRALNFELWQHLDARTAANSDGDGGEGRSS